MSTRTDTLFPYTTIFRAQVGDRARVEQSDCLAGDRVAQARKELLGHRRAADDIAALEYAHLEAGGCEIRRTDQAVVVVPRANSTRRLNMGSDDASKVVPAVRSEEHTSELQSLMRISYAVFCLKKKILFLFFFFFLCF